MVDLAMATEKQTVGALWSISRVLCTGGSRLNSTVAKQRRSYLGIRLCSTIKLSLIPKSPQSTKLIRLANRV